MSLTHIPTIGQYLYRDASSTAARGSVVFTPVTAAIPDGLALLLPKSIKAKLDPTGSVPAGFTLPTVGAAGVYYTVSESFPGGRDAYTILVKPTDTLVDLVNAAHYVPPDPLVTYQEGLTWQDEGVTAAAAGAVETVDFTGPGVTATASGGKLTVAIAGGVTDGDKGDICLPARYARVTSGAMGSPHD
jgi:hypothetical protein